MQSLSQMRDLFHHLSWADAEVWRAALALPAAQSDVRLRDWLYHIHTVQHAFLRIWRDQPLDLPAVESFENTAAIATWGYEYQTSVSAFFDTIEAATLERAIKIPWAARLEQRFGKPPASTTLAETMLQVTSHSTHHRGQVNARLRELGGEPPLIDFIAWLWLGKPPADWPEVVSNSSRR